MRLLGGSAVLWVCFRSAERTSRAAAPHLEFGLPHLIWAPPIDASLLLERLRSRVSGQRLSAPRRQRPPPGSAGAAACMCGRCLPGAQQAVLVVLSFPALGAQASQTCLDDELLLVVGQAGVGIPLHGDLLQSRPSCSNQAKTEAPRPGRL